MSVVLAKDSVVAGHMKLGQADAKSLKKLEKYGLNLGDLLIGGPLTEGSSTCACRSKTAA